MAIKAPSSTYSDGWLLGLGVGAGCALFAYIVKWSLRRTLYVRLWFMALGLAAMLAVWLGGFGVAFFYFFFKC